MNRIVLDSSYIWQAYYDDPKELARLTGQLTANITEPSPQLLSNIADITELIADPTTPKKIDTEGAYFFNIINNVMSLNASSLSSQGDKHNQSSASRYLKTSISLLLIAQKLYLINLLLFSLGW